MIEVFLSLGGNIGDVVQRLLEAKRLLSTTAFVYKVRFSGFYQTSPVSDIPQDDFVNVACALQTELPLRVLWREIEQIERVLGKTPKAKNAPRPIDIDILFYGDETVDDDELQVPHPQWKERLFVLMPLAELKNCNEIKELIEKRKQLREERVERIKEGT